PTARRESGLVLFRHSRTPFLYLCVPFDRDTAVTQAGVVFAAGLTLRYFVTKSQGPGEGAISKKTGGRHSPVCGSTSRALPKRKTLFPLQPSTTITVEAVRLPSELL